MRARERHSIQLSWDRDGSYMLFTRYIMMHPFTSQTIVIKHLSKAYNVNFGARSLAYEVEYVVLGLVAEAELAGKISKGWVIFYNMFFNFMT